MLKRIYTLVTVQALEIAKPGHSHANEGSKSVCKKHNKNKFRSCAVLIKAMEMHKVQEKIKSVAEI